MIEDNCADNDIPLPNVTSKILAKAIKYCKQHVDASKTDEKISEDDLKGWDQEFIKVDQATLFDLILDDESFEVEEAVAIWNWVWWRFGTGLWSSVSKKKM